MSQTMDDYWKDIDKHIARNRINKVVDVDDYMEEADQKIAQKRSLRESPDVDEKQQVWALKEDWRRPWCGNDYYQNPEMYCVAIKRKLEHEVGMFFENYPDGVPEKPWFTVFPPAELIPLHDAVFEDGIQPELLDPKPEPKRIKRWWDEDVLRNEQDNTLKDYNANFRAEWFAKKWQEAAKS